MRSRTLPITAAAAAAAALLVVPFAGTGHAGHGRVWHSGNGEWLKVDRVCRDGVIIGGAVDEPFEAPYKMNVWIYDAAADPNEQVPFDRNEVTLRRHSGPVPGMSAEESAFVVGLRLNRRLHYMLPSPQTTEVYINPWITHGDGPEKYQVEDCSVD
jgi:hypothetical protein